MESVSVERGVRTDLRAQGENPLMRRALEFLQLGPNAAEGRVEVSV
jgi:hypothetical protein